MANNAAVGVANFVVATRNTALNEFKTNEFVGHTRLFLLQKRFSINKIFGKLRNPTQPSFERRGGVINVVSVEAVAHFEAERVACAEANRFDAVRRASFKNVVPNVFDQVVGNVQFKTTRAGVARSRHNHVGCARKMPFGKSIVLHFGQFEVGERL